MRVSSLVGAAEDVAPPPPHTTHTRARAHLFLGGLVLRGLLHTHARAHAGSDVGRGRRPRRPAPPARPPSHLPLASKNIKRKRKPVSEPSRAHILKWLNLLAPNRSVAQALRFRVSITPAHERSPGVRCIHATLGAGRPHGSPTLVGPGTQWPWRGAQWNAPTLVGARVSRARPSPRSEPPHSVPRRGRAAGDVGPYHSPPPPHTHARARALSLFIFCALRNSATLPPWVW